MHLKRHEAPKNWPITRKGTKYVARPSSDLKRGLPLLILLRDLLKIVESRKELKKAISSKGILINCRTARNEKESVSLFDSVSIAPSKKFYRLTLSEIGKFVLNEINEEESKFKIGKIVGKKTVKDKKGQINLLDGRNFITDMNCSTQDSVLIDLKNKKIIKNLPLKEKAKILVFAGKHAGKTGVVNKIDYQKKMVEISDKKENLNILIKQLIVTD